MNGDACRGDQMLTGRRLAVSKYQSYFVGPKAGDDDERLARKTGAPVRVGFRNAREMAWLFYTHRVPIDTMEQHAIDRYLAVTVEDVRTLLASRPFDALTVVGLGPLESVS